MAGPERAIWASHPTPPSFTCFASRSICARPSRFEPDAENFHALAGKTSTTQATARKPSASEPKRTPPKAHLLPPGGYAKVSKREKEKDSRRESPLPPAGEG